MTPRGSEAGKDSLTPRPIPTGIIVAVLVQWTPPPKGSGMAKAIGRIKCQPNPNLSPRHLILKVSTSKPQRPRDLILKDSTSPANINTILTTVTGV